MTPDDRKHLRLQQLRQRFRSVGASTRGQEPSQTHVREKRVHVAACVGVWEAAGSSGLRALFLHDADVLDRLAGPGRCLRGAASGSFSADQPGPLGGGGGGYTHVRLHVITPAHLFFNHGGLIPSTFDQRREEEPRGSRKPPVVMGNEPPAPCDEDRTIKGFFFSSLRRP